MTGAAVLASRLAGSLTPPRHPPTPLSANRAHNAQYCSSILPYFEDADTLD